jgi:Ca-activated chloride channel family protein
MLALLWIVPAMAAVYLRAEIMRRRSLDAFAHPRHAPLLLSGRHLAQRRLGMVAVLAAVTLLVLAAARPTWNPQPQTVSRLGRDVVFVVDVSRSMLAEDVKPSRLGRAQFAILDALDDMAGDRVALVAFAGTAAVRSPLTHDYGFFRMMVESLSPQAIAQGGTHVGDALRVALEDVFQDAVHRYKDVILITDGEDHGSYPLEAAQAVGRRGVRLIALGIGDEGTGSRIPVSDAQGRRAYLTHDGAEVRTRLDAATLRAMVSHTPGGRYFHVATGTVDLADIYRNVIRTQEQARLESETVLVHEDKFQLFLLPAIVLLGAELALAQRRRSGS